MGRSNRHLAGFSLTELLVVLAVIAILVGLLIPALSKAKSRSRFAACSNNLRQIAMGVHMYAGEEEDRLPARRPENTRSLDGWTAYKALIARYVSTNNSKLFACATDRFHYSLTSLSSNAFSYIPEPISAQPWSEYSSYGFNGGNTRTNQETGEAYPGIAGWKLASVMSPAKTVLVAEIPAYYCFSWHRPDRPKIPHYFNEAVNNASFVDGHVAQTKFYWDSSRPGSEAWQYDPPAAYAYKWSGD